VPAVAVIGGVLPRSAGGMRLARVLNWAALGTQSSGADLPGCPSIAQRSCPARMHTCCRTGATERPQDRGPPSGDRIAGRLLLLPSTITVHVCTGWPRTWAAQARSSTSTLHRWRWSGIV